MIWCESGLTVLDVSLHWPRVVDVLSVTVLASATGVTDIARVAAWTCYLVDYITSDHLFNSRFQRR